MTIDKDNLIDSLIESLGRFQFVKSDDIPNIDLYMDQVTTFMDKYLGNSTRNKSEDKVLTKTMINNYAKNNLLPAPDKKKYSKEHVIILIFIYYFKNILSISDIQNLLKPITDNYFANDGEKSVVDIYNEIVNIESGKLTQLKEDLQRDFKNSKSYFKDEPEKEKEFLQTFSFICMLAFDVYTKKLIIETMIDNLAKDMDEGKKK